MFKTFKEIIGMTEKEMVAYLLGTFNSATSDGENYIYIKGDIPICLVAHMDTVRNENNPEFMELLEDSETFSNKKGILGADDRAGIAMILDLLEDGYKPSVIFTNGEETGAVGAYQFAKDIDVVSNVNLFIELDRAGTNHYVSYNHLPTEVQEYVESFGLEKKQGSFSDIKVLTDAFLIPSVNLAIGYYNEHSSEEFLVKDEWEKCKKMIAEMLQKPFGKFIEVDNSYRPSIASAGRYELFPSDPQMELFTTDDSFDDILIEDGGEFLWETEYSHFDNEDTMQEFLYEILDEDIWEITLDDGTYAEIYNKEQGYTIAVNASGNGSFYEHKVTFEGV